MKPYYQRAGVTLYHADCRDVLPGLPLVDLLVTDPPYGVNAKGGSKRTKALPLPGIANDSPENAGVVRECVSVAWDRLRSGRHAYVFGPFDLLALPDAAGLCDLVWDKVTIGTGTVEGVWAQQHERIAFAAKLSRTQGDGSRVARIRRGTVLRHQRPNSTQVQHVTEKPVPLLRELIEMSSRHGETVLDPFAGSGSTLVAALIDGRQAIGVELDEPWCEVTAKRIDTLTAQGSLFGGAP